jgi:hypothetical protein
VAGPALGSAIFICAIINLMRERQAPTDFTALFEEFRTLQDSFPQNITCEDEKEYGSHSEPDLSKLKICLYPKEKKPSGGEAKTAT